MMKRITAAVLLLLCCTLCACGARQGEPQQAARQETAGEDWEKEADFPVHSGHFAEDLDELVYEYEAWENHTVCLQGYVAVYPEGENEFVQFAVLRDYFDGEEDVYPVGIDCVWDGDVPEEDSWVEVFGTLSSYLEEDDYYIGLNVQKLRVIPDGEHDGRLVFG